jgi:hypothetical protein
MTSQSTSATFSVCRAACRIRILLMIGAIFAGLTPAQTESSGGLTKTRPTAETEFSPFIAPSSLAFGSVNIRETSRPLYIFVRSSLTSPLSFEATLVGEHAKDFRVTSDCRIPVPVDSGCKVGVRFSPRGTGGRSALLVLHSKGSSVLEVPLVGDGLSDSQISVDTNELHFTRSDWQAKHPVTILNIGRSELSLASLGIETSNSEFAISSYCTSVLAPGASCSIEVSLRSQPQQRVETALVVNHNSKEFSTRIKLLVE